MNLEPNVFWALVILIGCNIVICLGVTWIARRKRETWSLEDTLFCLSLILTGTVMIFFPSVEAWAEGRSRDRDDA